jgi:hypothetical protein
VGSDWTGFGFEGDDPQSDRVAKAVLDVIERAGFGPRYGRPPASAKTCVC